MENFTVGDRVISIADGAKVMKVGKEFVVRHTQFCTACGKQMIDIGYSAITPRLRCNGCQCIAPSHGFRWVGSEFFVKAQDMEAAVESLLEEEKVVINF